MNRCTVPDHQELAGKLLQQMLEEANHLGAAFGKHWNQKPV
jgi:hypothetical protein